MYDVTKIAHVSMVMDWKVGHIPERTALGSELFGGTVLGTEIFDGSQIVTV